MDGRMDKQAGGQIVAFTISPSLVFKKAWGQQLKASTII